MSAADQTRADRIDGIVFALCCALATFALGVEVGGAHVPPTCPTVAGHEVISTIDGRDGQMCVYAKSYGRALKRVKL